MCKGERKEDSRWTRRDDKWEEGDRGFEGFGRLEGKGDEEEEASKQTRGVVRVCCYRGISFKYSRQLGVFE